MNSMNATITSNPTGVDAIRTIAEWTWSFFQTSLDTIDTYLAYKASVLVWKIVPPILLTLGTVGNILSIIIFTRRSIRMPMMAPYLIGLALSDLLVLYTGLLHGWLMFGFRIFIYKGSPLWSKVNMWMLYTSFDLSSWILMALTLQRVISVWMPFNARSLCTKRSAIVFMLSFVIFLSALNSHMLYGDDIDMNDETGSFRYWEFFIHTWPWIDLCAFCFIPFSVLAVGNAMIVFKVIQSHRRTRGHVVRTAHTGAEPSHQGRQSSMVALLVTLSIAYLICTAPMSICMIGIAHWRVGASIQQHAKLQLVLTCAYMFQFLNSCMNFVYYCLSATKFRQEAKTIFYRVKVLCNSMLFRCRRLLPLPDSSRIGLEERAASGQTPEEPI